MGISLRKNLNLIACGIETDTKTLGDNQFVGISIEYLCKLNFITKGLKCSSSSILSTHWGPEIHLKKSKNYCTFEEKSYGNFYFT